MSDARSNLQDKINVLRKVYALELPSKVEKLEQCFSLLQRSSADIDILRTLQRLAKALSSRLVVDLR